MTVVQELQAEHQRQLEQVLAEGELVINVVLRGLAVALRPVAGVLDGDAGVDAAQIRAEVNKWSKLVEKALAEEEEALSRPFARRFRSQPTWTWTPRGASAPVPCTS